MGVLGGIVCVTNQSSDQEQKKLESIRASIKALNLKANDSPGYYRDTLLNGNEFEVIKNHFEYPKCGGGKEKETT